MAEGAKQVGEIISTFMFSDIEEIELLVIKIETEKYLVRDWIIVEGSYTFRGKPRKLILRDLINSDLRFKPYTHRLHILECHENYFKNFRYPKEKLLVKFLELLIRKIFNVHFKSTLRTFQESRFFYAEKKCVTSLLQKFWTSVILSTIGF